MNKMKISRSKQKIVFHQIFGAFHQNIHTSLNEVKDEFLLRLRKKKNAIFAQRTTNFQSTKM